MSEKYEERLKGERAEGREEGRAEGRAEGHIEGRLEKAKEIARNMKFLGKFTAEQIALCCGLSVEEVDALKNPV